MFILGLLVAAAALVCWAGSYLPILGFLFDIPFPDLLFASGALLTVGLLPLHRWVRIPLAVLLWAGASLASEMERLPQHQAGFGGVLAAQSSFAAPLRFDPGMPLRVAGNVNPFVTAAGPAGFATLAPENAFVLKRRRLMANMANMVEPVDLLWRLGYHPAIGAPGYPRIAFERTAAVDWGRLEVRAETGPGQVAARFRRTYPVPPLYPGLHPSAFQIFKRTVLHDNLLRAVLGLNAPVEVNGELEEFLTQVLGASSFPKPKPPLRTLRVVDDVRRPVPEGVSQTAFFKDLRSDIILDTHTGRPTVCGLVIDSREYGESARSTSASVLESPTGEIVDLASGHGGAPGFDRICDPATGRLLTFMDVTDGAGLRVAGYERNGRLAEVHYFEHPFKAPGGATVERGSLQRGTLGDLAFTIVMPIVILPVRGQLELEPHVYRTLALSGAPLK